jgi:hypothetical protein
MVACGGKTGSTGGMKFMLTSPAGSASAKRLTSSEVGTHAPTDDDASLEVLSRRAVGRWNEGAEREWTAEWLGRVNMTMNE